MTERINTRIDPHLKKKAMRVFERLGLSEAEAIRMFYAQVDLNQGIPFPIKIPNAENPKKLPGYKSFRDLRD